MANIFNALHYDSDSELSHNDTTPHNPITNMPNIHELIVDAITLNPQDLHHKLPDLESLHPHFGWVTTDWIHDTLEKTSEHYHVMKRYPFRKHFKSRFPAANVCHLNETFSTDTIIMDVPAKDDGIGGHANCTLVQLFTGADSEFTSIYPIHVKSAFPHALQDFIRDHGAMKSLRSDNAKEETSILVQDILKMYMIRDSQSKPHYQHQNPAERMIQDVKRMTTSIMDHVGCQAHWWLLCMTYVVSLLSHLMNSKGYIPKTVLTGGVTDVSPYLDYHFWQEIFVESPKGGEQFAYWCGLATKQGDFLTYNILLWDTEQLVQRSNVRPAKDSLFPNHNQCQPLPMVTPPYPFNNRLSILSPILLMMLSTSHNFLRMNSSECLLSANMMGTITTPRSYTRFLIGMPMTIRRLNSSNLSEMANSKNSLHITNYLISFLKRNRPPMMEKLTYSASIISLTIRALSNVMTHIIKVPHGMFMSFGMTVEPLGSCSMKLPSLTLSQWLCMPMNTAYSTPRDGIFSSGLPSNNVLSMLPSIMQNDALIPNKFVTNLGSRYHNLTLKLSNLTVTMAIPFGKTLSHSS